MHCNGNTLQREEINEAELSGGAADERSNLICVETAKNELLNVVITIERKNGATRPAFTAERLTNSTE